MTIVKPLRPMEIDPKNFMEMIRSFMKAYPHYYVELKTIANQSERECEKMELEDGYNLKFKDNDANFSNIEGFWQYYLDIEDIEYGGNLIENAVFSNIKASNHNAIFKASGVQNLSYSLVLSKVGIKVELLIKTLRKDIKDKKAFNKKIFDELSKSRKLLNSKVENLVWERLDDRIYSRIYFVIAKRSVNNKVDLPRLTIDEIDTKSRNHIFGKMASAVDKFYKAFNPIVKKIDIKNLEKKL
jgi:hypothetical protein